MAEIEEVRRGLDGIVTRVRTIAATKPIDQLVLNLANEVVHIAESLRDLAAIVEERD